MNIKSVWGKTHFCGINTSLDLILISRVFGTFPFNNEFKLSKIIVIYTILIRFLEVIILAYSIREIPNNLHFIRALKIFTFVACTAIVTFTCYWHLYKSSDFIIIRAVIKTVMMESNATTLKKLKFETYMLLCISLLFVLVTLRVSSRLKLYLVYLHAYISYFCIVGQFNFFVKANTVHLKNALTLNSRDVLERLEFSRKVHGTILKLYGPTSLLIIFLDCYFMVMILYQYAFNGFKYIKYNWIIFIFFTTWNIMSAPVSFISQVLWDAIYFSLIWLWVTTIKAVIPNTKVHTSQNDWYLQCKPLKATT